LIELDYATLIDLISLLIILIAIIVNLINAIKSYKSYKKNKITSTLLFSLFAFFASFAMIVLIMEKLYLSELMYDEFLGMQVFGTIAVILSGIALVFINGFAYNIAFTKRYKLLTTLASILVIIYLGFFIFDFSKSVENHEISFSWDPLGIGFPITRLIIIINSIILISIPVMVFLYYAVKIRSKSKTRSNRSAIFSLAFALFGTAYVIELIGLDPLFTTCLRVLFIFANILLYISLFKLKEKS